MAGIDKTYTDSYKDYKEFKDWADNQTVTFFDGLQECIGDWVEECDENDFSKGEIAIMNTPEWIDIYLIQNCNSNFVLKRMIDVYGEEIFSSYKNTPIGEPPPKGYKQNRKIKIRRDSFSKFPLHSKPYGGKKKWWLQCNDDFNYNEDTNMWVASDFPYPAYTNTTNIGSIKGVVRHLRKQYLPKGVTFSLLGKYVGEDYLVLVC